LITIVAPFAASTKCASTPKFHTLAIAHRKSEKIGAIVFARPSRGQRSALNFNHRAHKLLRGLPIFDSLQMRDELASLQPTFGEHVLERAPPGLRSVHWR